jgi:hypothetical protein
MADPLAINPEPAGGFNFKRMLPTLVIDVAMPIVAFKLLTSYGVSTLWLWSLARSFQRSTICASGSSRAQNLLFAGFSQPHCEQRIWR